MVETGSKPVSDQGEFRIGSKPVPEIGETGIEPPLVFRKDVDDFFHRVAILRKMKRLRSYFGSPTHNLESTPN